jgi:hypothetical protein
LRYTCPEQTLSLSEATLSNFPYLAFPQSSILLLLKIIPPSKSPSSSS